MKHDVIIIGGGLSGLSAAVDLASRGTSVLMLEARMHLGGRTRSFRDETTGDVVDNGQHLMMGCYKETRRLLRTIGADHLARLQPNLHIDFVHPVKGFSSLSCPPAPAPLHVLAGLLGLKSLSFMDRLKLVRVGLELLRNPARVESKLGALTVDQWLKSLGQPVENRKYLWDVIAIGSLNDDPKVVAALLFYRVLRAAFLGRRQNSSMLLPTVGLSELFVEPSVRYLGSHNSEAKTGCGVEELLCEGSRVVAARCADGVTRGAKAFVVAVPHYAFADLLLASEGLYAEKFQTIEAFESSPIVTINLWLDRRVIEQEFVALLDSRVQWIFNRTRMLNLSSRSGQYLSLVISGAGPYVEMEKEEMIDLAMADLRAAVPKARSAKVIHSLVVKEKRATFSPKPGIEKLRPPTETEFENLFLAGDWTATGLPATIEGAVISGKKAATMTERYLEKTGPVQLRAG
jgi:squalene-associated FAD-dependent desaturase